MLLEQIERRQKMRMQAAKKSRSVTAVTAPATAKTIGLKVPPDLYAQLEQVKRAHNLKSMKDALKLAAERGAHSLLHNRR